MVDWHEIDRLLKVAAPFILTKNELTRVVAMEQDAYRTNVDRIRVLLERHQAELQQRQFWTELIATDDGLRFRYSLHGFYGPGGFSSELHVAGQLVLGTIDPKSDMIRGFYKNDLEQNVFIGERFDEVAFLEYVAQNLLEYLAPENQILSSETYRWVKGLLDRSKSE